MNEADWDKLIIRQLEPNELRTVNDVIDKAKKSNNNSEQEKTPSRPASRNAISPAPSKLQPPKTATPTQAKATSSPAAASTPTSATKDKEGGSGLMKSLKTAVNTVKSAAVMTPTKTTTPTKTPEKEPEVEVEEVEQEDDLVFLPPPKGKIKQPICLMKQLPSFCLMIWKRTSLLL